MDKNFLNVSCSDIAHCISDALRCVDLPEAISARGFSAILSAESLMFDEQIMWYFENFFEIQELRKFVTNRALA